ncbi:putative non-specific serine/threonine protein kinase [Rosa chinensis]|uniref:Putative non-specific serine/threonine protein kinase n=1 Tax=Rosa chinensis TaxID=74649 RepID=A0A2P6QGW3_ROSCH|nr:putative non-specific serine/threonine protein kinase [Rosa chinensis]
MTKSLDNEVSEQFIREFCLMGERLQLVKRLFFNNRHRAANFYNGINIINTVEHKNLVRLLVRSCSEPESLLVYKYLANKLES